MTTRFEAIYPHGFEDERGRKIETKLTVWFEPEHTLDHYMIARPATWAYNTQSMKDGKKWGAINVRYYRASSLEEAMALGIEKVKAAISRSAKHKGWKFVG